MSETINLDELEERALDNDLDSIKTLYTYYQNIHDTAHAEYWKKRYESLGGIVKAEKKEQKTSQMEIWRKEYNSKQTEKLLLADLKSQISAQNPYALFVYADKYLKNNDEKIDAWERGIHMIETSSSSKDDLYKLHVELAKRCESLKKNNNDAYALKMLRHYENAYELKGDKADPSLLDKLSECYRLGIGTARDANKAVNLKMKASRKGSLQNQFDTAVYMQKNGNRLEAIELLEECLKNANGKQDSNIRDLSLLKLQAMDSSVPKQYSEPTAQTIARVLEQNDYTSNVFTVEDRYLIQENIKQVINIYAENKNITALQKTAKSFKTNREIRETALKAAAKLNDKGSVLALIDIYQNENNTAMARPYMQKYSRIGDNRFDDILADGYQYGKYGLNVDLDKAAQYMLSGKDGQGKSRKATLWKIAEMYQNAGNLVNAEEYYLRIANGGNAKGYTALADMLFNDGQNEKALEYYRTGADHGNGKASMTLSNFYREGKVVEKDSAKSREYLFKAAAQNEPAACSTLGLMYLTGDTVEKDISKAIELLTIAADKDNGEAACQLGKLYSEGKLTEQNKELAARYFAIAADQGNTDAAYQAGMLYREGSRQLAIKNLKNAADKGDKRAYYPLAEMYRETNDSPAALFYLEKHLENNPDDTRAIREAGIIYKNTSTYNPQSQKKAFEYLTRVSDDPTASFYLAQMYEFGYGVQKDTDKALKLYQYADKGGIPAAAGKIRTIKDAKKPAIIKEREKEGDHLSALKTIGLVIVAIYLLQLIFGIVASVFLGVGRLITRHPFLYIIGIVVLGYLVFSIVNSKKK